MLKLEWTAQEQNSQSCKQGETPAKEYEDDS